MRVSNAFLSHIAIEAVVRPCETRPLKRALLEGQPAALQQQFTLAKSGSGTSTAVNICPPTGMSSTVEGAAGDNTLMQCVEGHTGIPGKQKPVRVRVRVNTPIGQGGSRFE